MKPSGKIKIDFVAVPFSGHLYPLIELAKPLLDNPQYEIRIFTGVQKVQLLTEMGFTVIPLLPEQPTIMEEIANTDAQVKSNGVAMYKQLKQNIAIIPEAVAQLAQEFTAHQTALVVADFVAVPVGVVCQQLDIPWITTIPTPFAIETKRQTPSYLGGWKRRPQLLFKIRDFFGRKLIRLFKRGMVFLFRHELKAFQFKLYNEKNEESIYSPFSILGLGMKEIEFNDDFPMQFQFIGPCCQSPEEALMLDIFPNVFQKSIFISIGTHLKWAQEELIQIVEALADQYEQFLFVISLGNSKQRNDAHNVLKKNVKVFEYVPYSQYLQSFDYVIHHGGAGIFYQCIQHQKPALILPLDYDQFDYAARAEAAGIAIVAKKINKATIMNGFAQLIQQVEWQQLEQLSQDFKDYQPFEKFYREIKRLTNKQTRSDVREEE